VLSAGCQAKISGNARALPHKTTRYSLFATRCRFTIRQSLFAAVSRLADLPISRFADKIRLGRSLALPLSRLSSCASFLSRCLRKQSLLKQAGKNWRAHLLMRRKFSAVHEHCPPEKLAIRHSLLATRLPKNFRLQAKARIM
jgi:hypothetical protein